MIIKVLKGNFVRGGKAMKRIGVLSVLLITLLTSLLVGCTEAKLTQEDMEQLVADVLVANAEVDTCRLDIHTLTTIEGIGGSQPVNGTMIGDGTGAIDSVSREMQMTMNMTIDMPGQAKQEMSMESYVVGGWMHIKMDIPELGEKWMKMRLPEEMWETQSQIDQQIELLKTAEETNFLGSEDVDGTECYVVQIVPSTETFSKLVSQFQMPDIEGIDYAELNLANLVKDMSFKEWIAKDSYLFMKSETHMLMEMRPGDIGATEDDFEKITIDQNTEVKFYDYNEAAAIELPEKALEAQEITGN